MFLPQPSAEVQCKRRPYPCAQVTCFLKVRFRPKNDTNKKMSSCSEHSDECKPGQDRGEGSGPQEGWRVDVTFSGGWSGGEESIPK